MAQVDFSILQPFLVIAFGAIVVEALLNIVKNLRLSEKNPLYWGSLALGLIAGVAIAIEYEFDFFAMIGIQGTGRIPFLGVIITGLIISRGSNAVADIFDRINFWKRERNGE